MVWFYRKLAGMSADPEKPGYRNIVFCPQPAGDITFASYSNLTPNGTAGISWKKDNAQFMMDVTIPVGSTATVYIPASGAEQVREGGKPVINSKDISLTGTNNGYVVYSVASGLYHFQVN